jgi:hypothetical protein
VANNDDVNRVVVVRDRRRATVRTDVLQSAARGRIGYFCCGALFQRPSTEGSSCRKRVPIPT